MRRSERGRRQEGSMTDVFAIVTWAILAVSLAMVVVSVGHNLHRHRKEKLVQFRG